MKKLSKKAEQYWLEQSQIINWKRKPKKSLIKKKKNFLWFPNAKLNVYHNCITNNIDQGFKNKIALYVVDQKKKLNLIPTKN